MANTTTRSVGTSPVYEESIMATATASSLVSENILDPPSLDNRRERRAALRHKAKTILNEGVIAAVNATRKGPEGTTTSPTGTPVRSTSTSTCTSGEQSQAQGSMIRNGDPVNDSQTSNSHQNSDSLGSEYRDDGDGNDDIYAQHTGVGILESGKQWFHAQKVKWQKQALEEKVEAQRRILLEKTIKKNKDRKMRRSGRAPPMTSYVDGNLGFSMMDNHHRSLGDNEAYQSITQRYKDGGVYDDQGESMGIGFCGGVLVGDEDEDYILEDDAKQDGEEGDGRNATHDISSNLDQSAHNSLYTSGDDEDSFFIGTPHGTYTGGIAVQLELIEGTKKKKKNFIKLEEEPDCSIPYILTLEQMTSITEMGLPPSVAFSKWRRLYSLQRDGDSFSGSFLKKVKGQEKTLLVVQTTNLEVFGAYTNSPWEAQGYSGTVNFYGSAQACLFSIDQERLERNDENNGVVVYKWTGKNRYIQVCDLHHKMLALGGGGKDGEFGICVEDDFRVGSTGPCDTFDNAPLCKQDRFEIMNVECYGFITGFC